MAPPAFVELIRASAVEVMGEHGVPVDTVPLRRSSSVHHGHYSTNLALRGAHASGEPARALAGRLADAFGGLDGVEAAEVAGPGFVNLRFSPVAQVAALRSALAENEQRGGDALAHIPREPIGLAGTRTGLTASTSELSDRLGADTARYAVARARGVAEYADPSRRVVLDLDLDVLRKQTEDNPAFSVRYAHARAAAVLRNAAEVGVGGDPAVGLACLDAASAADHGCEGELMLTVAEYPAAREAAVRRKGPRDLARYLERLGRDYLAFYYCHRAVFIGGGSPGEGGRDDEGRTLGPSLALSAATRQVLAGGLGLLGVTAPERI